MKYDIFISYRRKGGYETAKHLYDLFSKDGYRVSFDLDTLRNGDFDQALLKLCQNHPIGNCPAGAVGITAGNTSNPNSILRINSAAA